VHTFALSDTGVIDIVSAVMIFMISAATPESVVEAGIPAFENL